MSDRVEITADEAGVVTVTLSRPDKHNAVDDAMFDALVAAAESLRGDPNVRAVVLHGAGKSFCSGIDISRLTGERKPITPGNGDDGNRAQQATCRWAAVPVPVIAAIHGYCLGAGAQIALGADLRIAAPDAKIAIFETNWGLVPDMGLTRHLPRLVPFDVAQELTYTGRTLSGTQAAELGLVTRVAEDPLSVAAALASEIASRSPDAIRAAKRLLHEAWNGDVLHREAILQQRLFEGPNQRIAVTARRDGETPAFGDPTISLD